MMGDLISRSTFVEALNKEEKECEDCMIMPSWHSALKILDEQPTVDAVPVVHANWKQLTDFNEDKNAVFECTNCLHGDVHAKGAEVPYCWYCGAKMDGKKVQE